MQKRCLVHIECLYKCSKSNNRMTLYSSSSNRAVSKLNCYVVIVQNKTVLCAVF